MKINSKKELRQFLELNITNEIENYALITYEGETQIVSIGIEYNKKYKHFVILPCVLRKHDNFNIENKQKLKQLKKQGYMVKDGCVYEIETSMQYLILPNMVDDLTLITKEFCLSCLIGKLEGIDETNVVEIEAVLDYINDKILKGNDCNYRLIKLNNMRKKLIEWYDNQTQIF